MEQTKLVAVGGDACTTQNQGVRHGGVIDHAGDFISSDLGQWAEGELAKHGGDFHAFAEQYEGQGLRATKLLGKTHYLVASTGSTAAEFLQVEIEELQEVVSHELFGGDDPGSLEELAGASTLFSKHWVLAVREYIDRYHQPILQATPVAAVNGLSPKFASAFGARGMVLYEALQQFDRRLGWRSQWWHSWRCWSFVDPLHERQ